MARLSPESSFRDDSMRPATALAGRPAGCAFLQFNFIFNSLNFQFEYIYFIYDSLCTNHEYTRSNGWNFDATTGLTIWSGAGVEGTRYFVRCARHLLRVPLFSHALHG